MEEEVGGEGDEVAARLVPPLQVEKLFEMVSLLGHLLLVPHGGIRLGEKSLVLVTGISASRRRARSACRLNSLGISFRVELGGSGYDAMTGNTGTKSREH
eukprot:1390910-Amorphochlora_amoeboformis.AAC.1